MVKSLAFVLYAFLQTNQDCSDVVLASGSALPWSSGMWISPTCPQITGLCHIDLFMMVTRVVSHVTVQALYSAVPDGLLPLIDK